MTKLDAALYMARRGFPVFPLVELGKKPAVEMFQINATTDEGIIREWWSKRPNCNIGVCTTGFVVVDIDDKHGRNGTVNYASIEGHYNTLCVRTPSGGHHCYFTGPDSKLAVDIVKGVDIRSHHGYVVAPGSVTSSVHKDCVDGSYELVNDAPLAPVPYMIGAMLMPPIKRERHDNAELDKATSIAQASVWLQTAEPAIEGMHGNDTTYRVCARLVRDFALSEETAFQLLLSHWNYRCVPPWEQSDLLQLVNNAATYGVGDRGRALAETQMSGATVLPVPPPAAPKSARERGVYMGNAVDPTNLLPRPWKVMQMLMNGDVTVVGGMGASGKSILNMILACHWGLGKDFMNFKLRIPGVPLRTIIYNAEDDMMEQSRRMMAVCHAYNFDYLAVREHIALMDDRGGELCLAHIHQGSMIQNDDDINFIAQTAVDAHADVLMFDPLVNLHRMNESDNGHMRYLISILRAIARATNTAVMCADHTSKGASAMEKGNADAFRGASAKVNSARVGLLLSPITKDDATQFGIKAKDRLMYARMDNAKANYDAKTGEAMAWFAWSTMALTTGDKIGVFTPANFQARIADKNKEMAKTLYDALTTSGSGGMLRQHAANVLQGAGGFWHGMPTSTIFKAIDTVLGAGPLRYGDAIIALTTKDNGEKLITLA